MDNIWKKIQKELKNKKTIADMVRNDHIMFIIKHLKEYNLTWKQIVEFLSENLKKDVKLEGLKTAFSAENNLIKKGERKFDYIPDINDYKLFFEKYEYKNAPVEDVSFFEDEDLMINDLLNDMKKEIDSDIERINFEEIKKIQKQQEEEIQTLKNKINDFEFYYSIEDENENDDFFEMKSHQKCCKIKFLPLIFGVVSIIGIFINYKRKR